MIKRLDYYSNHLELRYLPIKGFFVEFSEGLLDVDRLGRGPVEQVAQGVGQLRVLERKTFVTGSNECPLELSFYSKLRN